MDGQFTKNKIKNLTVLFCQIIIKLILFFKNHPTTTVNIGELQHITNITNVKKIKKKLSYS